MTLVKAIELLDDLSHSFELPLKDDYRDALKLSIFALQRIAKARSYGVPVFIAPLPGETPIYAPTQHFTDGQNLPELRKKA